MIEIQHQIGALTPEHIQYLFHWKENVFDAKEIHTTWDWLPKEEHFFLYDDGILATHVGIVKTSIEINGRVYPVAGIGSVVTIAEKQRMGFARHLMQHAMDYIPSTWDVMGGALFCNPNNVSFYHAMGWRQHNHTILIPQPNRPIFDCELPFMLYPFGDVSFEQGTLTCKTHPW